VKHIDTNCTLVRSNNSEFEAPWITEKTTCTMSIEEKASLLNKELGAPASRKSFYLPRNSRRRKKFDELRDSFSLTDRQQALEMPGVGPAASMIKDAVLGYQDAPYEGFYDPYADPHAVARNIVSIICGRLTHWTRGLLLAANWTLFALTFLEPPQWCRDSSLEIAQGNMNDSLGEYGDCKVILEARGISADGEEGQDYYPNSNAMLLSVSQSKSTELYCTLIIALYMVFKMGDDGFRPRLFFYPGHKRRMHLSQCTILVCLLLGNLLETTILNPLFRLLILGSFLRNFQREFWTMLSMIPKMAYILTILAMVVFFYAWFGVIIFYGTEQGANGFQNLIEAIWTLWICITTANYPDVMMPSYNENRYTSLYFVSFMTVSFFYLMNLILAITVNSYDDDIAERKRNRSKLSKKLLKEAYAKLDPDNENAIGREAIMCVMLILNQDVPEIDWLSETDRSIFFAFLDRDGSSDVSLDEFLDFGHVLLLKLTKQSDYHTFVERHFPKVNDSNWYQALVTFAKSKHFEHSIDFILVLNAVIVLIQDYPLLIGRKDVIEENIRWEYIETMFTALYALEVALKVLTEGWKRYRESLRNMFDFAVTCLALIGTAYISYPNASSNRDLIRFIIMVRVVRVARLLFSSPAFQMFGIISFDILPAARSVFMILLFLGYIFASVGMFLYGGLITRDPANPLSYTLLEASDFVDNAYWANNFNDMFSGINVLFNLLVVNNWTECEIGFEYVTGAKWVRFFFFSFHLLGVIVISNVVTSFIINAYFQQLETIVQRLGQKEIVEGGTIEGGEGFFNASKITGTKTGATSGYYARINPRHVDVEVDETTILKRMLKGIRQDDENED